MNSKFFRSLLLLSILPFSRGFADQESARLPSLDSAPFGISAKLKLNQDQVDINRAAIGGRLFVDFCEPYLQLDVAFDSLNDMIRDISTRNAEYGLLFQEIDTNIKSGNYSLRDLINNMRVHLNRTASSENYSNTIESIYNAISEPISKEVQLYIEDGDQYTPSETKEYDLSLWEDLFGGTRLNGEAVVYFDGNISLQLEGLIGEIDNQLAQIRTILTGTSEGQEEGNNFTYPPIEHVFDGCIATGIERSLIDLRSRAFATQRLYEELDSEVLREIFKVGEGGAFDPNDPFESIVSKPLTDIIQDGIGDGLIRRIDEVYADLVERLGTDLGSDSGSGDFPSITDQITSLRHELAAEFSNSFGHIEGRFVSLERTLNCMLPLLESTYHYCCR
ncbi:MAG: hypothetical protein LBS83_03690 [Holosporales bacterium]|jgi:hypothetical protein|nr:hypothetical protein [Holosporales bacterium]